jgi:hypothetical protein
MERKQMSNRKLIKAAIRKISAPPHVIDSAGDYSWGFFSREDPRMHLQSTGKHRNEYHVWLEKNGNRVFEPDKGDSNTVFSKLYDALKKKEDHVESTWVRFMLDKGWLNFHLDGKNLILKAYPGLNHSFTRTIDLTKHSMEIREGTVDPVKMHIKLDRTEACIILFSDRPENQQIWIEINVELWKGSR